MNILAIDTSTEYLSLAVARDDKILVRYHRRATMRHSILLLPTIAKLLKKARLEPGEIDCFAVSVGPGSFTGLRISIAAVKGLAYALKKPIAAIPTLDAIAENAKKLKGTICPVLDARKGKVYACLYRSDGRSTSRISGYLLLTAADLTARLKRYGNVSFLGDGVDLLSGKSAMEDWHPRPEIIARLGLEKFREKDFVSVEDLEPLYLYSKECDIKGI